MENAKELESLCLPGTKQVSEEALSQLISRCSNLKKLNLFGGPHLGNLFVRSLTYCTALIKLNLCEVETIGDSEIHTIAESHAFLKKLKREPLPVSDE